MEKRANAGSKYQLCNCFIHYCESVSCCRQSAGCSALSVEFCLFHVSITSGHWWEELISLEAYDPNAGSNLSILIWSRIPSLFKWSAMLHHHISTVAQNGQPKHWLIFTHWVCFGVFLGKHFTCQQYFSNCWLVVSTFTQITNIRWIFCINQSPNPMVVQSGCHVHLLRQYQQKLNPNLNHNTV